MEKMPYQPDLDRRPGADARRRTATISSDWRNALPVLTARR